MQSVLVLFAQEQYQITYAQFPAEFLEALHFTVHLALFRVRFAADDVQVMRAVG